MTVLEHVSFSYGDKKIFDDFSFEFAAGKVTAVTGPSGTGKTTLLKLLAKTVKPDAGLVAADSPAAVMFQEPRLLPWFSVKRNLTAVLGSDSENAAMRWLKAVHLEDEADSLPETLSGGMQQRVSLARVLAYAEKTDARLVILDEPFSALDRDLHSEMRALALNALKGRTVILISHDEEDKEAADCLLSAFPVSY